MKNYNMLLAVLNDSGEITGDISIGKGALYSVISIAIVFTVLVSIIAITSLASLFIMRSGKSKKQALDSANAVVSEKNADTSSAPILFDVNDEEMVAAVLTATADYREETHKNIKLISVRRVN